MMARPELGTLVKGQIVLIRERPRAAVRGSVREMQVVTLGPRWVGLCDERWAGTTAEKSHIRRYLLKDQREGEPGRRVGYGSSFATREQYEYDTRLADCERYIRDVAGIEVRRGDGPFSGEDGTFRLASLLSASETSWRPDPS